MAEWRSREDLEDHFRRHGREVYARDLAAYARMADATIERGVRFTYRLTGRPRVGYYDRRRGRFVAIDGSSGEILSLSRRIENSGGALPDSSDSR